MEKKRFTIVLLALLLSCAQFSYAQSEIGPNGAENYLFGENPEINFGLSATPIRCVITDTTAFGPDMYLNLNPFAGRGLHDHALTLLDLRTGDPAVIWKVLAKEPGGDSSYVQPIYDFRFDHRYNEYTFSAEKFNGALVVLDTNFMIEDTFFASNDPHATSRTYVPALNRDVFVFFQALWDTLPNNEVVHGAKVVFVDADTKDEVFVFRSNDLLTNGEIVFPYEYSYVDSFHNGQTSWIGLDYIHPNSWKLSVLPTGEVFLSMSGLHMYELTVLELFPDIANATFQNKLKLVERIRPYWDQFNKITYSDTTSWSSTHSFVDARIEITANKDTMVWVSATNNNWAAQFRPDLETRTSLLRGVINTTKDTGRMADVFKEDQVTGGWGGTTNSTEFRIDNPSVVELNQAFWTFSPGAPGGIGTEPAGIPWGNPQLAVVRSPSFLERATDTLVMVDFVDRIDTSYGYIAGTQYNSQVMVEMGHVTRQRPVVTVDQNPNDSTEYVLSAVGNRPEDYIRWTDSAGTFGSSITVSDSGDYFAMIHYPGSLDSLTFVSKRVTIPPKKQDVSVQVVPPARDNGLTIYPNPVSGGWVNIRTEHDFVRYRIYNTLGQTLVENSISSSWGEKVDISNLSPGMYLVTVFDRDGRYLTKRLNIIK